MVKIPDFAIIFVFYAILNGVVFSVYAYDKRKAQKNTGRTPESQLLFCALIGPFGAYAAMQVFRHKTLKTKFLLVPLFLVLHIAVILYIISSLV
jgi:uncharacterized membrane protein YsdA (DUF1294 family)